MKAKTPEPTRPKRLKFFLYGPPASGKTVGCIQLLPKAVIIDTENGCANYGALIRKQGSVILASNEAEEIIEEVRSLLSEKHEYTSLIIDPITVFWQSIQDSWTSRFKANSKNPKDAEFEDFGPRFWARAKSTLKRFLALVARLDMNVAMTAHQKDQYSDDGGFRKTGVTFDGEKRLDYFFDFVFRMEMAGPKRMAYAIKQRSFPETIFKPSFEWDADSLRKAFGEEAFERPAEAAPLATAEQVQTVSALLERLKREGHPADETASKWKDKAGVEDLEDMRAADLGKCIAWCETTLASLTTKGA